MTVEAISQPLDLAPVLRALGNSQRLAVLRLLGEGLFTVETVARRLGLSRPTARRHLAILRTHRLVRTEPGPDNCTLYTIDRDTMAILNLSLLPPSGALREGAPHPGDLLPASVPEPPEACTRCNNRPFVREVLTELERSLTRAREYQTRLRQLSTQVLTAQEEERKRIARELHDDTAQALTSVLVRLRLLERSEANEGLRKSLAELRELTGATLGGVRRLAIALRPPLLDDLGLEAALRALVQEFSRRCPVQASFTANRLGRLPPDVELVLYRIVQEGLSNVAKHAQAASVRVSLTRNGRHLCLLVEDDGCGFDVAATRSSRGSGLGLFGMEERLALVGGSLRLESAPGVGTRIVAHVPLPTRHQR